MIKCVQKKRYHAGIKPTSFSSLILSLLVSVMVSFFSPAFSAQIAFSSLGALLHAACASLSRWDLPPWFRRAEKRINKELELIYPFNRSLAVTLDLG